MKYFLIFLMFTFVVSCNDSSSSKKLVDEEVEEEEENEEETAEIPSLEGKWLTECLDFGGGALIQIWAEVKDDGKNYLAFLTWDTPGCSGSYNMTWNSNPITEPFLGQNLTLKETDGIPENFNVIENENLTNDVINYVVAYYDGEDTFYELVGIPNDHTTWEDWLTETDVEGFKDDPENFVPTTYQKFKFNRVEALP